MAVLILTASAAFAVNGPVFVVDLAPLIAENIVGEDHTVTATVEDSVGNPLPGVLVTFSVLTGPNSVQSSSTSGECTPNSDCTTDANGEVSWTYTSNGTVGADTIVACLSNNTLASVGFCSPQATKNWVLPLCNGLPATIFVTAGVIVGGPDDGLPYTGYLRGTPGNDVMVGTDGPDLIKGFAGDDTICGAEGNDRIEGGAGDDWIDGGPGADLIKGQFGNDTLNGGEDNDRIEGGPGDDTLDGGPGNNILNGGTGLDGCFNGPTFYFCDPA